MADSAVTLKTLRFERLNENHIPAILEIEQKANSAPWSERSFLNELGHAHGIMFVAIANGVVAGYGGVWLVIDEAHITTVAVHEDYRRLGIGRKLMVQLLEEAKEAGMLCSTLEVRASNEAAVKLYEGLGYHLTTRRKAYYPDNKEDALVLWLDDLQAWKA